MLFCTSRGFQWFVMLKTVKPARPLYFLPRKGIFSAFVTSRSSVKRRGKRPPRCVVQQSPAARLRSKKENRCANRPPASATMSNGTREVAPEEQPMGRVERLRAVLVRTNDGVLQIAEVGVEVVQIAARLRPHVRQEDVASFLKTEARHRLKLAITRTAVVLQQECVVSGFEDEVAARVRSS